MAIDGTPNRDTLFGSESADQINGRGEDDQIFGLGGNDFINGGGGGDVISGGAGNDRIEESVPQGDQTTSQTVVIPSTGQELSISLTLPDAASGTSLQGSGFVSSTAVVPPVNIAFVVDVSGSTGLSFTGTSVGDLNNDGLSDTVLDGEIAGGLALLDSVINDAGLPDANVGLISFASGASTEIITQASADADSNGILDIAEELTGLRDGGSTDYSDALQEAIDFFQNQPSGGTNRVIFLSDGEPNQGNGIAEANNLRNNFDAEIRAIGVGTGAQQGPLDDIDDNQAEIVADPGALSATLSQGALQPADIDRVEILVNGSVEQVIPAGQLTQTALGLQFDVDLTGLDPNSDDQIVARAIATDADNTQVSTQQTVEDAAGSDGRDVIFGGLGADTIRAASGNDLIDGGDGNDNLNGGIGADVINGGRGRDDITGGDGKDVLNGGRGNDNLAGNGKADHLRGGDGGDTLSGGFGNDTLFGNGKDDKLQGGDGKDSLFGGFGNDTLFGNGKEDELQGGEGKDSLFGGFGNDTLFGNSKADRLQGDDGKDELFGGFGNDKLVGNSGDDLLAGEQGDDTLIGGGGEDSLRGADGNDYLSGDGRNDWLQGGSGSDALVGGNGGDTLIGNGGGDRLQGDDGKDALVGGFGNDELFGNGKDDRLQGDDGKDALFGGFGNDELIGNGKADILAGENGNDTLTGGFGNDDFVFADNFGGDIVTDFGQGADEIDLSAVSGINGFTDLSNNHLSQSGSDAVITDGADTITLENVNINDLGADDFGF